MLSFKNCNIYIDNDKIIKSDLTINNGRFESFKASDDALELNDKYIIVPGFIEQHIHGAMGCDVMDCRESALHSISASITQDGVTSWLPTTMTMSKLDILSSLQNIADIKHLDNEAKIQGIHLEGPFINKQYKGAQDESFILEPNIKDMDDFVLASKNKIKIVTVAAEKANQEFLDYCKAHGITVSLGHTAASGLEAKKAFKMGVGCTTHTFNAMDKSLEDDGVISAIKHSDVYAELILDLFHVPADVCKELFKFKKDKLILVTDSIAGRYMPDGQYKLGTNMINVTNGQALLPNGKKAGSVLRINQALKNVKKVANLSIEQTIDLVAKHPAANLGLNNLGCISLNNPADFVIIDKDFNIYQTYVNGKLVFDSNKLN